LGFEGKVFLEVFAIGCVLEWLLTLILHPPPIPMPPIPPMEPPVEEAILIMPVDVGDMPMPDIAIPVLVGGVDMAELIGMSIADDIDIAIAIFATCIVLRWLRRKLSTIAGTLLSMKRMSDVGKSCEGKSTIDASERG
jgi:hypothetical protein